MIFCSTRVRSGEGSLSQVWGVCGDSGVADAICQGNHDLLHPNATTTLVLLLDSTLHEKVHTLVIDHCNSYKILQDSYQYYISCNCL